MKLALGTVQFGLNYGISNKYGQTNIQEIEKIFKTAIENKINLLDTAPLYGQSEEAVGKSLPQKHSFNIVSKTPHFLTQEITNTDIYQLTSSIKNSLKQLKQTSIYGILFHNKNQLLPRNGDLLIAELNKLKKQKIIQKFGFSVTIRNNLIKS